VKIKNLPMQSASGVAVPPLGLPLGAWHLFVSVYALCSPTLADETADYSSDRLSRVSNVEHIPGISSCCFYDALGKRLLKSTTLAGVPSIQPPAAVTNPSIANGVTNVRTTSTLSWSPAVDPNSGNAVVYFIYFGTSPTPPLVFSGWTTNWSPGKLSRLTTCYCQVVARDSHNAQNTRTEC